MMRNGGIQKVWHAWNRTLLRIQQTPFVSSQSDGEDYICRTCEIEDKPCLDNPLNQCSERILGGTELQAVQDRYRSIHRNNTPRCARCGKTIPAGALKGRPLSELCPSCRGNVKKVKRSTLS